MRLIDADAAIEALCEDRCVDYGGEGLVTDGDNCAVGYYRKDAQAWDSVEFGWLENRTEPPYGIKKVIAWMPLPEPWKGE